MILVRGGVEDHQTENYLRDFIHVSKSRNVPMSPFIDNCKLVLIGTNSPINWKKGELGKKLYGALQTELSYTQANEECRLSGLGGSLAEIGDDDAMRAINEILEENKNGEQGFVILIISLIHICMYISSTYTYQFAHK